MQKKILFFFISVFCFSGLTKGQTKNLDYYLEIGLKNNPLLIELKDRLLLSGIDSALIKSGMGIQLNLVSQAMYAPAGKNFGFDSAITNGGNYSAVVNATKQLFNRSARNVQLQNISLLNQSDVISSKMTENDLRREISTLYLSAYSGYKRIIFEHSLLKLLTDEQKVIKQLVDKGIYLQTDLINFSLSMSAQEITIRQSEIQFRNDLSDLNFVCGIADTSLVELESPVIMPENTFDINNSTYLLQLRVDSLKSETGKSLIDLNYKPKLNAFTEAGFNSVNPENIPENLGASVGLSLSVPIYDGHQRKLMRNKYSITENTRQARKSFYIAQFNQQLNKLSGQLRLTDELISDMKKQVTGLSNLIDLYKMEIEKGLIRIIDFLSIINNYSEIRNAVNRQEFVRLQIINQMNYLR